MRYAAILVCVGSLALGGCRHKPMYVCTDNSLTMKGPVETAVTADMQSTAKTQPLSKWTVEQDPAGCRGPKVALIDVDGLLVNMPPVGPYSAGENPVALFREKLDAVAADPQVCGVVIRINTLGGGVTATDLMWKELMAFRARTKLPTVACLMDLGTGGGYYLATAADEIHAHPTTITGGIGVIFNHFDLKVLMDTYNVFASPVKAGKNIDMGTCTEDLPEETKAWLQAMADEFHRRFQEVVISRRPQVDRSNAATFDGRIFTAGQALQFGLIDRVGYLDGAIEAVRMRAGRPGAAVVMFHRRRDPARTPYAVTPNTPGLNSFIPLSMPGLERSKLPAFLYMWQPDPTLMRSLGQ